VPGGRTEANVEAGDAGGIRGRIRAGAVGVGLRGGGARLETCSGARDAEAARPRWWSSGESARAAGGIASLPTDLLDCRSLAIVSSEAGRRGGPPPARGSDPKAAVDLPASVRPRPPTLRRSDRFRRYVDCTVSAAVSARSFSVRALLPRWSAWILDAK